MGTISALDNVKGLERGVQKAARGQSSLDVAAQQLTSYFYDQFRESILLCRLFATIPFGQLPAANQQFARELAQSAGVQGLLSDDTLILSLMGTRGKEEDWNHRERSKGHIGIPLVSGPFVQSIPMLARLLKQLGLGLDWLDAGNSLQMTKTIGSMRGAFFVPDAAEQVDEEGRKIIAAQEFVGAHQVKTVFGLGGAYVGTTTFMMMIFFCSETIAHEKATGLMPVIDRFKVSTRTLVEDGRFFA